MASSLLHDEHIVGIDTPDPLRFGFTVKSRPHAGGAMKTVPVTQMQTALMHYQQEERSRPRCLYIHVPFCRVRCIYCNFFQNATHKDGIAQYVLLLLKEIAWKSQWTWTQKHPFDAVYIGGGTPTDLSAEQIRLVIMAVRQAFPLKDDCEITLEGRIHRFSDEKVHAALDAGVNRFSFGVQSFDTKVRRAAKRLDDGDKVLARLQTLSKETDATIVLDLLYGLPYQETSVWRDDLALYQESGAQGVDLYQLIHLQGLPMGELIAKGRLPQPANSAERANMFAMGVKAMNAFHSQRLSNNHWAHSQRERSLYNHLAKSGAEILPIGAGAGGGWGEWHWMQSRDLAQYRQSIEAQRLPAMMVMPLATHHQVWGAIKGDLDRGYLMQKTLSPLDHAEGQALFQTLMPLFEIWQTRGFVSVESDAIRLTLAGQFWAVNLTQILLGILQAAFAEPEAA